MDAADLPLEGVRVLDLSRLLPGPLCAQHLCDLGAHVIKIEDPQVGDYARPAIRALVNRGKKGLTLNLKTERGREIFLRLVDRADVVLESFRPGVMKRLGLDYSTLQSRRPSLIYCAVTGFGQSGPRNAAPGHDINYVAVSGVLDRTGSADGPPVIPGFLLADILGGTLTAAMGILAALLGARASGRGRFIDVSMADALLAHCVLPLAEFHESGSPGGRGQGRHTGGLARYNIYEARDGRFIAVGAEESKFWNVLCEAIGAPDLIDATDSPLLSESEVIGRLKAIFAQREAADWIALLEPLDCCVTPVLSFEEALSDSHIATRTVIRDARTGKPSAFRSPFAMSDCEPTGNPPSPRRGEHNREILESIGYLSSEIRELASAGVI